MKQPRSGGVRIRSQWHRSCLVLMTGMLAGLIVACSLLSLAVSTHAVALPSVLVHTDWLWVGDLCRATLNSAIQYTPQCSPGYTVDVIVYGRSMQHYTVVQIPPFR
jgi:hypothetical protein